jgi:hypothetical protein
MKRLKAQVTERALLQRLNRALAKQDLCIRTCSDTSRWFRDFGRFYCVSLRINAVDATNIDLEEWGRKEGVLHPWEKLADEGAA